MESVQGIVRRSGATVRQIRRWTSLRLLPRPRRVSKGPGKAAAFYPEGTSKLVRIALQKRRTGRAGNLAVAFERARWEVEGSLQSFEGQSASMALKKWGADGISSLKVILERLLKSVAYVAPQEALAELLTMGLVEAYMAAWTEGDYSKVKRLMDFRSNVSYSERHPSQKERATPRKKVPDTN